MPLPADDAVSRRDGTLARTRRASRWITAAAIAAAVILGSAFAHALPGHHTAAQAATTPARPGGAGPQGQQPARHHHAGSRRHRHLQPAPQPPAQPTPTSTPTPPPVVSGGS
jgi:hypothetical protein